MSNKYHIYINDLYSDEQNSQLSQFFKLNPNITYEIYQEKIETGTSVKNQVLQKLGTEETIVITKIEAFAKSIQEFAFLLQKLVEKKVTLKILNPPLNFSFSSDEEEVKSKILLELTQLLANFDRARISNQTKHGIALKKQKGEKTIGRPKKKLNPLLLQNQKEIQELRSIGLSISALARRYNVPWHQMNRFLELSFQK